MNIWILPEARPDLEMGGDFYESQSLGLGRYFLESLTADIDSLRLNAGIPQWDRGRHRMLAIRFPFAIYYDLNQDVVEIYAVLDCRQKPSKISNRLK